MHGHLNVKLVHLIINWTYTVRYYVVPWATKQYIDARHKKI